MEKNAKLRDYQQSQINFLYDRTNKDPKDKRLFTEKIALESPTGSGKSFVMLKYVENYFKTNNGKIFISTGYNNLVFQLYEDAIELDIPVLILIGKNNCNCLLKMEEATRKGKKEVPQASICDTFTKGFPYSPKETDCAECSHAKKRTCLYDQTVTDIVESNKMLVITNHSTFSRRIDFFEKNFIGGFFDECHAFGDFYESSLGVEITPKEFETYALAMAWDKRVRDSSMYKIFLSSLKGESLRSGQVLRLLQEPTTDTRTGGIGVSLGKKYCNFHEKVKKWDYLSKYGDDDCYVHPQVEEGKFNGVNVDKFFTKFCTSLNYCITSATVDTYTMNIFGVERKNFYKERNCNIMDYANSHLYLYDDFTVEKMKEFISQQTGEHGLFLSTRLSLVKEIMELGEHAGYAFINNKDDFEPGKKQILVGSKSLFQGIDIPGLSFVMLNKIPFPKYDIVAKKRENYIASTGLNPYSQYIVPVTVNQLIQSMGRLWRAQGDNGNVALFDKGAKNKHYKLIKEACSYRPGIQLHNRQ